MNRPLKSLQVLRGLAAIAVVLYHIDILSKQYFHQIIFHFSYGALGVDFFFALSGFIITYIHFNDLHAGRGVANFLIKRFIRIFPFYWLCVTTVLLLQPERFASLLSLVKNLFLFRMPMTQLYISVSWSLTYEIIFYVVFALAIAFQWSIARFVLPIWIVLIIFNYGDTFANVMFVTTLFNNMVIEFLFGCIAAYLFAMKRFVIQRNLLAGTIVLAIATIVFLLNDRIDRFSLAMTSLIGFASALVILYAAMLDKCEDIRWKPSRVLVLLGDASYAIYLTHTIYLVYLFRFFSKMAVSGSGLAKTAITVIIFLVCISLGVITHLVVEKPVLVFLRRKAHLILSRGTYHQLHKV